MRRTWGYIVMAVASLVGVGALMLPMPETFEPIKDEPAPVVEAARPAPSPHAKRKAQAKQPKPPPPPPPAPVKKFPMQDTTKDRIGAPKK